MRGTWIVMGIAAVIGLAAADEPPRLPRPNLVPDRSWTPKPGDTATAYAAPTPAAKSEYTLLRYLKLRAAQDATGMERMVKDRSIVLLADRPDVLVIERHDNTPQGNVGQVMSPEDFANSVQAAALAAGSVPPNLLEVRVLAGPLKGESRFIAEDDAARLIPEPTSKPRRPKAAARPTTPEERAATRLRMGKALEKSNRSAAVEHYRKAVAEAPGGAAAIEAAARIKALAGGR